MTETPAWVAHFTIYSFCKNPEYHQRLKAETVECKDASFGLLNQEVPHLDYFVKETARLSPGVIRKPAASVRERRDRKILIWCTGAKPSNEVSAPRTVMVP